MAEISFVLPALNEGHGIGSVIDRIPKGDLERRGYKVNVWVLDGRSTDRTVDVAKSRGANIMLQDGRGKGRAVAQAFDFLRSDLVIMLDADNTYDPRDVMPMLPLLEDGHDVVMGSRLRGQMDVDAMTDRNRIGNKLISSAASAMYGKQVSDLCTGFWGFKGQVLRDLVIDAKGFELEAQMFSRCVRSKYVIGEVPISYGRRNGDETKLRSYSAGAKILWTLIAERIRPWVVKRKQASRMAGEIPQSGMASCIPEMK